MAAHLSRLGKRQLHIAETEKYAHVTYFFNGGVEEPFTGEDRILVPSNRDVPTYDLAPEMSAVPITDALVDALGRHEHDLIVANYANADMVGHSGKIEPTTRGCEAVDQQLGNIYKTLQRCGGSWIITADHGNAEMMIDPKTNGPHTYHTTNPVPFIVLTEDPIRLKPNGALKDVAPTILGILGLEKPKQMAGEDLRIQP